MPASHEKRPDSKKQLLALLRLLAYAAIAAVLGFSAFAWHAWAQSRASAELALNYEQAPNGLTPSGTRFAVSFIKSEAVLTAALEALGQPELTAQQLAESISISPADKTDGTPSPTRYIITYKGDILLFSSAAPSAEEVLRAVMQAAQADFAARYFTSALPQPNFNECSALEYIEAGAFMQKECARLERFLQSEQTKSSGSTQAAETLSALALRLNSLEQVDLENFNALVLQSGAAKNSERMQTAAEQWSLAHTLAGSTQLNPRGAALQQGASQAETEKAELALDSMRQKLTALYAEAAAAGTELAAQRAQRALSMTYKASPAAAVPRGLFAAAVGCAVFCALCAGGLLRRRREPCQPEKACSTAWPKRGYILVLLAALAAGALFYQRTGARQVYTAKAVIQCGTAPEAEELFSEANVLSAKQSFCLSVSTEAMRSGGSVSEGAPDTYTVTLALGSDANAEQARFALDALLSSYCARGGDAVPANASRIYEPEHDYLEQAELLSGFIGDILPKLEGYAVEHPEFASANTGYTLGELAAEYRTLRDGRLAYVIADILQNRLTKDSALLVQKYRQRCESPIGRTAEQNALDAQILAVYTQPEQPQSEQAAANAASELDAIQARLQQLHPTLLSTLSDFYQYSGAYANTALTPVTASPEINVWLYALLGAGGVFIGGCALLGARALYAATKHEVT